MEAKAATSYAVTQGPSGYSQGIIEKSVKLSLFYHCRVKQTGRIIPISPSANYPVFLEFPAHRGRLSYPAYKDSPSRALLAEIGTGSSA
jgi:hypothetical protein